MVSLVRCVKSCYDRSSKPETSATDFLLETTVSACSEPKMEQDSYVTGYAD